MRGSLEWMERHQVPLYLVGLGLGALTGLVFPSVATPASSAIHPVLVLLLYVTFLGIPLTSLGQALGNWRFLTTIMMVNFIVVPAVVWVLSRIVAGDQVLMVGVLFVLLTPCIDYVIVFTGLAGGDQQRLLAAAPLLMLVQMLLLPLFLRVFVGEEFIQAVDFGPFVEAFLVMIALPLAAAALTQYASARTRAGRAWQQGASTTMVPLMVLTLATVVASQISGVQAELSSLLLPVVIYILFAAIMAPLGAAAAWVARLDVSGRRAIIFSGVTRNSLVILPLVLALPVGFELAPLVVVTQTLVELFVMVTFVRIIPRYC